MSRLVQVNGGNCRLSDVPSASLNNSEASAPRLLSSKSALRRSCCKTSASKSRVVRVTLADATAPA